MKPNKNQQNLEQLDKKREQLAAQSRKNIWPYMLVPVISTLVAVFVLLNPFALVVGAVTGLISYLIYYLNYVSPFNKLKFSARRSLLKEFMNIFHPDIKYGYKENDWKGDKIVKESNLISYNRHHEEDVIYGSKKNIDFYISELTLKKKRDKNTHTVFKGILFKLKLKGRSFPKSRITSTVGILNSIFNSYQKSEKYGFYYDSQDSNRLYNELEPIFPFIRHLMQSQGNLRIALQGDTITILLDSDMKFLDDPKPKLNTSFQDKTYQGNMAKQLNTLLFIVESFADELSPVEIEEKLKLRMLDYAENRMQK